METRRRPGIDVARILALLLVVGGHLTLAVVDRPDGRVRGANLLALRPGWAWIAALAPMPVFFAAGGWANATSRLSGSADRLRTLVGLGAAAVGVWSAAVVLAWVVVGDPGMVGDGARIATQPLWFLAAYVPFAAGGGRLGRLAAYRPVLSVGACLVALAALDVTRFVGGAPEWVGWPGFFLAWGTPWLLGGWWRARAQARQSSYDERWVGGVLLVVAGGACAALVAWLGYSPALIDAVPGARSNTTPPTLYTALAGVAQVGALMVGAGALDRLGQRGRRLWSQAGELAVGVYVWHLTALALAVGLIAAGLPTPSRLEVWWWLSRPVWWAVVLAITGLLVGVTAAVRGALPRRSRRPQPARLPVVDTGTSTLAVGLGIAASVAAAALIGLRGPRSVPLALMCTTLFATAWWLLGQHHGGTEHLAPERR